MLGVFVVSLMLRVANKTFILSVIILSVVMLSVVMLSVIMLSVVMLSVVMLSVVMLNVIAPIKNFLQASQDHFLGGGALQQM